jgi:hypothetical protein
MRHLSPLLFALLAACSSTEGPKLCPEIPEGGCPTGRGGSCQDPVCKALYDCIEGAWQKTTTCDNNSTSSGSGGASSGGAGGSTTGTGGCTPVKLDHTGETTGCMPDLQIPDCPAAAAEQCSQAACKTGCTDFFVCTAQGWTAVGYCDAKGNVVPSGR